MHPNREAPGVRLRPVQEADFDELYRQQADPAWAEMVGMPSRGHDDFVAHMRRVIANSDNLSRVIEADGEVVGSIGTFPVGDVREVGYTVAREQWGRGIASAALALILEEDLSRPLHAGTDPGNAASRRVLEKLGFVEIGIDEADGFVVLVLDA
ncbi:MAG: GNAT family N-acetyltransferase [Candidatus Nanopelagicales bacterium]